ncbi:hypothetical protein EV426DRAFT_714637 [Tirmania nivea]|nr:hypothetical protein EV426DRAFT_714637 [Tirmania nivea]
MTDLDPGTEKRLFSLGVNNRILPPTRFVHKFTPQDDRIARSGGPYAERKLQFPEFLKVLKEEKEKMDNGEFKPKNTLTALPLEIIYNICDYLPASSINALSRAGDRTLSAFAQRILFAEFNAMQWFIGPPTDKFYEYVLHPKAGLWKEWSLQLYWYYHKYKDEARDRSIQDMSRLSGVERLVLKPGFEYEEDEEAVKEFLAQDFEVTLADQLGKVMLCNITKMIFCVTNPNSVKGILRYMKKLTWLSLYFDSFKPSPAKELNAKYTEWNKMISYVGDEVGQTLRFLAIDIPHKDLDPAKSPFAPLESRDKWPHLEILRFGQAFFSIAPEDKPPNTEKSLRLMSLLKQVCDLSVKHGGWTINRLVDGLNPFQFALLDAEGTKKMVNWLNNCKWNKQNTATDKARPSMDYHLFVAGADANSLEKRRGHEPWSGHMLINDNHFNPVVLEDSTSTLPQVLQNVAETWAQAGVPLKLELQIERPYWKENLNIRENLWKPLIPYLDSLHIHPSPCEPADLATEQGSIDDWIHFMDQFLPQCHNLSRLRIQGAGDQMAPIFILAKHAKILRELCLNHKLRHLDIDFGALMQPGTFLDYSSENPPQLGADVQEPRMVMHQVMWISMPDNPEDPSKNTRLANLESLTLRNMFVYREIEMTWVGNIPAKLKKLQKLEFIGLVWALGYDPDERKRSKWAELEKEFEDMEELDGNGDGNRGNSDDGSSGGGGIGITGNSDAEPEDSGFKKKSKGKKKNKGKESKGEGSTQDDKDSWEDDSEEEDENVPSHPRPEGEEPIKWFEPKNGDYARYNLERVPSRDEEAEAEKRRKRNKKKAESKKRKRLEKKLAEQRADGDDVEKGLGTMEGTSRSRNTSQDDSDEDSAVDSITPTAPGAPTNVDPRAVTSGTPVETSIPGDAEKPAGNTTRPKKKKKSKGKKPTGPNAQHPALPPTVREDDPDAAKKTRALVQSIETQFTKFNLGENNELTNATPHHDDGLLAWLPHKDDPTSNSDSKSDEDEDSDGGDSSDPGDSDAESDISIVSTLFGSDPRYPRDVNIDLRKLRHRDWLIRVLLETATRTGGNCRDIRIRGMKLNGAGQKVWDFDLNRDADLCPGFSDDSYEWDEEDDEDLEFLEDWGDEDEYDFE